MKTALFLSSLNARWNTALDAVAESITFAVLAALCEAGRAKDRLLWRCRTRAVCCWCGRALRRRWFFWRRDTAENVTGGCCPACLAKYFHAEPRPRLGVEADRETPRRQDAKTQ